MNGPGVLGFWSWSGFLVLVLDFFILVSDCMWASFIHSLTPSLTLHSVFDSFIHDVHEQQVSKFRATCTRSRTRITQP